MFLLNIYFMQKSVKYLHRARRGFYVFIDAETVFFVTIWNS